MASNLFESFNLVLYYSVLLHFYTTADLEHLVNEKGGLREEEKVKTAKILLLLIFFPRPRRMGSCLDRVNHASHG